MYIHTKLMHKDILRRLNSIKKPQKHLTEKLNVSRSTMHRLSCGKKITFETFLKLLEWLEYDANRYINNKKRYYYD